MRKSIKNLIKKWNDFRIKISSEYYYHFDAKDRKKYCSLMTETFPVLREELQNKTVNKDICFLFAALGAFGVDGVDDGKGNCMKGDLYVDVASFHECFMKALQCDLAFDEDGFLIVPNMYHDAEYDETPEFHVDTTCFNGIEEKIVEWIPPEQDISRFEMVDFGPYEWLVLKHSDGKTLLLSKDAVSVQPFEKDKSRKEEEITYFNSSLRRWINSAFLSVFSIEEQQKIVKPGLSGSESNNEADAFFLLSKEEMLELMPIENERIVDAGRFPVKHEFWWLRSTHCMYGIIYSADVCSGTGYAGGCNFFMEQLVRPAVWVKSTSK